MYSFQQCHREYHSPVRGHMKELVICRFPKDADAPAMVYSLVETAKAKVVNVSAYRQYLLTSIADGWHNHPSVLDMLMPWSKEVQS